MHVSVWQWRKNAEQKIRKVSQKVINNLEAVNKGLIKWFVGGETFNLSKFHEMAPEGVPIVKFAWKMF